MSNDIATVGKDLFTTESEKSRLSRALRASAGALANFFGGLAILFAVWWIGIYLVTLNPSAGQFADFGPIPALTAIPQMWDNGQIPRAFSSSGFRLGAGLLIAVAVGVPIGIIMGRNRRFRELSNSPFQLLRMISPLSWEPIAVIVFSGWDKAIIFLIAMASVWPVIFATSAGLAKVDPAWFKVARNLGAKPWHILTEIIVPAITFDVLTGIRLALGIAWIVLVPAEFLGVTSGFGYIIEDARESLSYDHLMGMVLVIGMVGYVLDSVLMLLIRKFSWHHRQS